MIPSEQAKITVQAIKRSKLALGLTWQMRYGTVIEGIDPDAVSVLLDGDTEAIDVISIIGQVYDTSRVVVLSTSDGGQYITGYGATDPHGIVRGESGSEAVTTVASSFGTTAVTFAAPFTRTPTTYVNVASGAGSASGFVARAINETTTGFTILAFRPDGVAVSTTIPIEWLATIIG